jgi:hypothetical protein
MSVGSMPIGNVRQTKRNGYAERRAPSQRSISRHEGFVNMQNFSCGKLFLTTKPVPWCKSSSTVCKPFITSVRFRPAPPNSSRSKATDLVDHSSHRRSTNELLIPLELLNPSRGSRDPGNCAARLLASRICVCVISWDRLFILSRPLSSPPATASLYQA